MMYYKYRNLENFKKLIDIFLNERFYAATYNKLNDEKEGHFYCNISADIKKVLDDIKAEKLRKKICSLAKTKDNFDLWKKYANDHNGIAIGVDILLKSSNNIIEVDYVDTLPHLSIPLENSSHKTNEIALHIFKYKLNAWSYEEEVRVITEEKSYVRIKIHEVIFGYKVANDDKKLIKTLINKLNLNVKFLEADFNGKS